MEEKIRKILLEKLIPVFGGLDYESPCIEGYEDAMREIMKLVSLQSELIEAYKEYNKFIGKELNRHESMIAVRPYMAPSRDAIQQGVEHRNMIALLTDIISK